MKFFAPFAFVALVYATATVATPQVSANRDLAIDFEDRDIDRLVHDPPMAIAGPADIKLFDALKSKNVDAVHEGFECPICFDVIHADELATTKCKHILHEKCFRHIEGHRKPCPVCGTAGPHEHRDRDTFTKSLMQLVEDKDWFADFTSRRPPMYAQANSDAPSADFTSVSPATLAEVKDLANRAVVAFGQNIQLFVDYLGDKEHRFRPSFRAGPLYQADSVGRYEILSDIYENARTLAVDADIPRVSMDDLSGFDGVLAWLEAFQERYTRDLISRIDGMEAFEDGFPVAIIHGLYDILVEVEEGLVAGGRKASVIRLNDGYRKLAADIDEAVARM